MKVTWYKGKRSANFDDTDKILAEKLTRKGYGPKKETPSEPPKGKKKGES